MPSSGTPISKAISGARGVPISVTEAGPPEKMMALGANSAIFCGSVLKGMISQ